MNYRLMHKDKFCGEMSINTDTGALLDYRTCSREYVPFLGNANARLMARWLAARAVPASRNSMRRLLEQAGVTSTLYLVKNLALSLTDTYWICPSEADLSWDDVNLYEPRGYMEGILPYHNATSYDPNATLGGQMEKYWNNANRPPVLVKTAYRQFGQQAVNEAFATMVHSRQRSPFPYVSYEIRRTDDNGIQALCPAFTSIDTELVPAMEVMESEKPPNDISLYDHYIAVSARHGIDRTFMSDFMDYQTLTDFVISNTDEHLANFGMLRNTDTFRFMDTAPIFDSGNSMFFEEMRQRGYSREELLRRKITSFHDSEEKMLRHVKNRKVLDESLLPEEAEVMEFFAGNGIPEEKARFISESYGQKLSLLHDFLLGRKVSLFIEREKKPSR